MGTLLTAASEETNLRITSNALIWLFGTSEGN